MMSLIDVSANERRGNALFGTLFIVSLRLSLVPGRASKLPVWEGARADTAVPQSLTLMSSPSDVGFIAHVA